MNKKLKIILSIVLVIVWLSALIMCVAMMHDIPIYHNAKIDAKIQYINQSNSDLTGEQKIDLINFVCNNSFSNIENDLWSNIWYNSSLKSCKNEMIEEIWVLN